MSHMFKLNIITQLLSFFMLAVIINQLNLNTLFLIMLIFMVIISLTKTRQFLRSIKRFKWFFLVMMVIFAFNTPGEHLAKWPFTISPTYEGIMAGFTQTLRIATMLAALSLILAVNTRQQLISGFYFIFSPLQYLGLEVERFAARLWLTLHYVELQRDNEASPDFLSRLKDMTNLKSNQANDDVAITFKMLQFNLIDYIVIAFLIGFSIFKVMS
jgi:energy-coupling factor transporter transmembrane protein EcfT